MSICKGIIPIIKTNLQKIIALRNTKRLKPDKSFVSEGDLLIEKLIYEYFSSSCKSYIIISEERYNDQKVDITSTEFVITLDPIDGTENFVSGLKEWGVGVCIYKYGQHYESLIALPELNQYLVTGQSIDRFSSRIYGLSSSLMKKDLLRLETGFEYRIIGCSMYNMYNAIVGSYQVFQNPKGAHSWDILPGLNLALEHKLEVIVENNRYHGEFLQPNKKYRFTVRNI
jgi:myo-inositol-1(or 4)-monophosphatase